MREVRFLIVDDHPMVREGIERLLGAEFPGATMATASVESEALAVLDDGRPAVVILDLNLPARDGLDVLRNIKDRNPACPVLIHTMYPESQFGVRAMRGGADGYLTKDQPVAEFLTAVKRLLGGKRYISPALVELLADTLAGAVSSDRLELLSDREHQVLRRLAAGETVTEIAQQMNLSVKTVSTYRGRLLEKLQLKTTAALIRFGIEHELN
jgi:two-component system, NarL family, invasion response regulator UvrY